MLQSFLYGDCAFKSCESVFENLCPLQFEKCWCGDRTGVSRGKIGTRKTSSIITWETKRAWPKGIQNRGENSVVKLHAEWNRQEFGDVQQIEPERGHSKNMLGFLASVTRWVMVASPWNSKNSRQSKYQCWKCRVWDVCVHSCGGSNAWEYLSWSFQNIVGRYFSLGGNVLTGLMSKVRKEKYRGRIQQRDSKGVTEE